MNRSRQPDPASGRSRSKCLVLTQSMAAALQVFLLWDRRRGKHRSHQRFGQGGRRSRSVHHRRRPKDASKGMTFFFFFKIHPCRHQSKQSSTRRHFEAFESVFQNEPAKRANSPFRRRAGDAIPALRPASGGGGHHAHVGLAEGGVGHAAVSASHHHFPRSTLADLCSAHRTGKRAGAAKKGRRSATGTFSPFSSTSGESLFDRPPSVLAASRVSKPPPFAFPQSSRAEDACVTVKYNLAGRPSQSRLGFALRPKEDTG